MTTDIDAASGAAAEVPAPDVQTEEVEQQVEETKPEEPSEPEAEADKEAKAFKAMQRRIDKRTRDLYAERAQREQLERELAALKTPGDQPSETPQDIEKRAEQRARELVEQQRLQTRVRETLDKGKAIEGFDAAVNAAIEDLGLLDAKGRPTDYLNAVLDADAPHELLHYLGTHPEAADSLQGLSPNKFAYRLAHIETQMREAKAPKTSAAPKPITPVKATSTERDPASMSFPEYQAWRRQRVKARHG